MQRVEVERVWALSDVHVDHAENMAYLEGLEAEAYGRDALLVAGDVSHRRDLLIAALRMLATRFRRVFFVPGNHDLWVHMEEGGYKDSLAKFSHLLEAAEEAGVSSEPALLQVAGEVLLVLPLFSWHDPSLDSRQVRDSAEEIAAGDVQLRHWMDHACCRWPSLLPSAYPPQPHAEEAYAAEVYAEAPPPSGPPSHADAREVEESLALAEVDLDTHLARNSVVDTHFCALNSNRLKAARELRKQRPRLAVLSFSHFAASAEAVPPRRRIRFKGLAKVAGSPRLARQVAALAPDLHVFGHSHLSIAVVDKNVLHIQSALKYPRERKGAAHKLLQVWPRPST